MPLEGTSNEYPQHMFLLRNKKKNKQFLDAKKRVRYLELWIVLL